MGKNEKKWEKKSERFEVRLPYSEKEAFTRACENHGDTPSRAVRRFINGYIRRADADALKMAFVAFKAVGKRNWVKVCSGLAVLVLMFGFGSAKLFNNRVSAYNAQYGFFGQFDKNQNGLIEIGEISDNDEHLHAVLDIDNKKGISPKELFETGVMVYAVGDIKTWRENTQKSPVLVKHYKQALSQTDEAILVTFDLRDYQNIKIQAQSLTENIEAFDGRQDRIVIRGNKSDIAKKFGIIKIRYAKLVINSWDYGLDKK